MVRESLHKLYLEELKDLHSAEEQILDALPKMIEKTKHPELKRAFQQHLTVTEQQLARLDRILGELGENGSGKTCKGMKGLVAEGNETMKEFNDSDVLDAAMIAAAQRIEHYEMAGYGCARTYAHLLGLAEQADLLQRTLDEEGEADHLLTQLAESTINVDALK